MKLSHIRDLVAVAEFGGLRRAARHLGIAQPALSRSIRDLESDLGVTLFERGPTGMTLTPAGEACARRGAAVQTELTRARDELRQLRGEPIGRTLALRRIGLVGRDRRHRQDLEQAPQCGRPIVVYAAEDGVDRGHGRVSQEAA